MDLGAAPRRPRRSRRPSRRPPRAPGRSAARGSAGAPRSRPIVSATSRAGSTTVTVLSLLFEQPVHGVLRVMEGPDQLTRTIAVRESCPDQLPLGSRARAGARRGARRHRSRARAGRARGADPRRPPPGAARGLPPPGSRRSGRTRPTRSRRPAAGHTIVTTGTASGKSLAFNLPVLDTLASDLAARAFYLYPTKALAQDQARGLAQRSAASTCATRSTTATRRERSARAIRQRSNLILTNPDMLHVGVLPNHRSWGDVLANLAWVVVDEAHVYRGVFGSHVANVLRRLRRLARAYGSEPRFLLTSATIANPTELAERLTGVEVAARGPRRRPAGRAPDRDVEPAARGRAPGPPRVGAVARRRTCSPTLVEREIRTICFLKSRRGVELIQRFARQRLEDAGRHRPGRADRALPRRLHAGPAARDRAAPLRGRPAGGGGHERARARHRHRRPRRRDLRDVPGHGGEPAPDVGPRRAPQPRARACTWRARTRSTSSSAATPTSSSSGRWSRRSSTTSPRRSTWPTSPRPPTSCRSRPRTARSSGRAGRSTRAGWCSRARCASAAGATCRAGPAIPAARIALRSASPDSVAIVEAERGEVIGNVETARAHSAVHPGAVYLHMGAAYEVEELDLAQRRALVRPFNGDWYTQPKKESETWIEQVRDQRDSCGVTLSFGDRVGDRAGGGLPEEARDGPLGARPAGARPARAGLRDAGALVRAARLARARGVPARGAPGLAARGRARPDRGAAADRDVRPLGHRRPLDRLPPPDRPRRRSSSTTATPAAWASRARASSASRRWWATRCA